MLKPSICHTWLKFAARYLKASLSTLTVMSKQLGIAAGLKQIREANEVLAKNMKQEPTDEPAGTAGAPAETAGAPKRAAPAPSAAKKPKKPKTTTSPTTTDAATTYQSVQHRRQAKARKAARASKATAPTAEAKEPATKAPKTASASTEAPRAPKRAAPPDAAKEPATKAPKKASASEEPEVSPEPEGSLQPEVSPESDCSQPKSILRRPAAATPTEKASVSFSGALQAAGAEAQRLAASVAPQLQLTQAPAESVAAGPVAPSADDDELDLGSVDINEICRLLGKSRDTPTKAFKRTIPGSGIDPRVNTETAGSREAKVAKMPDNLCTEMATGCKSTEHWVKVWAVKYKGDWGNYEMIERDIRRDVVDDYDEDDWYTLGMMEKHFNDPNVAATYKAVLEKNPALTP